MTTPLRSDLEPLTARLQRLPLDARGYPVPWFVAWIHGVPDFRVVDTAKFLVAVKERRCWICGQPLGRWLAFPIGPMCAITRTTSEPPCHLECATWSVRDCPFLANPNRARDESNLPADHVQAAGFGLTRNPGVTCLWLTRTFDLFQVESGQKGVLITIGEPAQVTWWREGRPATVAEVEASIAGGFPTLLAVAQKQGDFAVEALGRQYKQAERLWQGGPP
jgi:hypothetical protein